MTCTCSLIYLEYAIIIWLILFKKIITAYYESCTENVTVRVWDNDGL
jgi:hypothetical protein